MSSKTVLLILLGIFAICTNIFSMQIFVDIYIDYVKNRTITLEVEPSDYIENIRLRIADVTSYPPSAVDELYYNSTLLLDGRTLADCNIGNESTLYLYVDSSLLPVELTSFNVYVKYGIVTLKWNTATEINNYGFEIERSKAQISPSADGLCYDWEKIGFVEGHGNSNSPKEYSFIDESIQNGKYSYRLKQIDVDGKFAYSNVIEVEVNILPIEFSLSQNYPNPFNPSTTISFGLPKQEFVTLKIYDILGKEITSLINEEINAGSHTKILDASNLSSGVYFYKLQAGKFSETKKMILTK